MFKSLPGFRDFYPEDCSLRNAIFSGWREVSQRYAFEEYDAPILESLELLTAKSGDEIVSQLFNFEDKGGRAVTLRPELTPSLARMVGAKAGALRRPIKWFSVGENFRYERQQKGRLRSFYQFNADILGEPGAAADAEIIGLLIDSLTCWGLTEEEFCVRLSDRDLWLLFLEGRGIVGEDALVVLNILDKFEREKPESILQKLEDLKIEDAEGLMKAMTEMKALADMDAIQAFFEKLGFEGAVRERVTERIAQFKDLLGRLECMERRQFIRIDLGIVRGLAYYTGFVFEAFQTIGKGRALAGGGRYDHLVGKLGGPELPAVGFGMGDVTLRDLLEERSKLPVVQTISLDAFIVITGEEVRADALRDVARLRREGYRVEYSMKGGNVGKQFKLADQLGAPFALVYGKDEVAAGKVKIKDLAKRIERELSLDALCQELGDVLRSGLED